MTMKLPGNFSQPSFFVIAPPYSGGVARRPKADVAISCLLELILGANFIVNIEEIASPLGGSHIVPEGG